MNLAPSFSETGQNFPVVFSQTQIIPNGNSENLNDLLTNDKSSLVAAINELVLRVAALEKGNPVQPTTATLGAATLGSLKLGY